MQHHVLSWVSGDFQTLLPAAEDLFYIFSHQEFCELLLVSSSLELLIFPIFGSCNPPGDHNVAARRGGGALTAVIPPVISGPMADQ